MFRPFHRKMHLTQKYSREVSELQNIAVFLEGRLETKYKN